MLEAVNVTAAASVPKLNEPEILPAVAPWFVAAPWLNVPANTSESIAIFIC